MIQPISMRNAKLLSHRSARRYTTGNARTLAIHARFLLGRHPDSLAAREDFRTKNHWKWPGVLKDIPLEIHVLHDQKKGGHADSEAENITPTSPMIVEPDLLIPQRFYRIRAGRTDRVIADGDQRNKQGNQSTQCKNQQVNVDAIGKTFEPLRQQPVSDWTGDHK